MALWVSQGRFLDGDQITPRNDAPKQNCRIDWSESVKQMWRTRQAQSWNAGMLKDHHVSKNG